MVHSTLIVQPAIAFDILLKACDDILDHKVTEAVDNSIKRLSDTERFLSILAAMPDQGAPVGLSPHLLTQVSFSILTVAPDVDMMDILECCAGMPFTHTETKLRAVLAAVITGTMQQWRDAVVSGTKHSQSIIRSGFNQIHDLFVQVGLCSIWNDYEQQPQNDGTYKLLEYKP